MRVKVETEVNYYDEEDILKFLLFNLSIQILLSEIGANHVSGDNYEPPSRT